MINPCDKMVYEILSDIYPSAEVWSCYPFKSFDFKKHVRGIRKELGIGKKKELFSEDKTTKQRLIELNRKSLLIKKKKIKKLIIGIFLTVPLFITVILYIAKVLSGKKASIIILLFSLILFVFLLIPVTLSENKYKSDVLNKFRKTIIDQANNITITRDDWVTKNCDCPKK